MGAAGLLALSLAAWHGVPGGTFQFDDLGAVLSAPAGLAGRIRPLLALTFQADLALHGPRPAGFLAENLVLHCLSVLLVHALARRVLSPLGAFLAAATFALQPSHAEVVAYVSGRSTGLMALLLLAALWAFLRAGESPTPAARRAWLAACLGLFAAASGVKEVALVFPLLVLVWGTLGRREPDLVRRVLPLAAAAGVLALGLWSIPRYRELAGWSFARHPAPEAMALNLSALPVQLSLWLRPGALSVEHPLDEAALPLGPALVFLGAMGAGAFLVRRRAPRVALAVAWAFAALLPTQSLLAKADVVTEKPLYLAWFGAALLAGEALAGAAARVGASRPTRLVLVLGLGGAAWLAGRAVQERVHVWSDPVLLWTDATRKAPGSSRAWNNLGNALRTRAPDRALLAVRRSLDLDPSNRRALANRDTLEALCPAGCAVP